MSEQEIDSEDINKEEDLMFGYSGGSSEPVDLLADYLPEGEDFAAKTVLTKEQVHLLAALDQLTELFDELEDYDGVVEQWIKAYEKRLTSVHGLSREEFVKIMVSMNGGTVDSESQKGTLQKVLDTDLGNNTND